MPRRVVILGAGLTGALLAHRLTRAGWSVTVLEARHVGAGSSSRTAAGIRQQFSNPGTVAGMRFSVDFFKRFRENVGGDEVPIIQNGYLFLHALEEAWGAAKRRVEMQQRAGLEEVVAMEPAEVAARFPWVDRHTILGATFCPTDGFLLPATVYNEAMAAAVAGGATLVQNAPVTGVEGRISAVVTPKGTFSAEMFVDCTNAWSARVGEVIGATPLPIAPLKRYLWFAERAGSMDEATLRSMPLTIAPCGAYCRPEGGSSLLMGFAHNAQPEPNFSWEDQDTIEAAFSHRSGFESQGFATWAALSESIPALGEFAGIRATTSGYYATTPDHNPFLDVDPAVPNLVRLVGFSGHGAMFGPFSALVGAALADAGGRVDEVEVMGKKVDLRPFRIGRAFHHAETMVI